MPHSTEESTYQQAMDEPIAIVGMSCALAGGVDSPEALWQTLVNKEIKQSEKVPASRFNIDAYYREDAFGRPGSVASRGGFFLDTQLDAFDADFFGFEDEEASATDPQVFRTLETVYECLESAGQTLETVKGSNTAVYIGNFSLDTVIKSARHSYDDRHLHEVGGIDPGLLSSRVSYCFGFTGPVMTTNAGCTSSQFALHAASLSLRTGQCSAAVVGGVNLLQGPEAFSSYSKFGIISPDSMCHTFDARSNGYCRAEGAGALYVKLLSDAVRDGDPIRGVVRTITLNSNGSVPGVPIFVPNQAGLEKNLELAYSQARLDPAETAYVETHGIGMPLGEIFETGAIGRVMNKTKRRPDPLLVGSLKPNFGHQEAASGIFVAIKAALMTEKGIIPAHADFQTGHPKIDFDALNIKVQTETIPWPDRAARRVGVLSYGWSGTNAHLIVEDIKSHHAQYQVGQRRSAAEYSHDTERPFLLTLSAHNEKSLTKNIAKLVAVVDEYYPADLAYTLSTRRSKFAHRAFAVFGDSFSADGLPIRTGVVEQNSAPIHIELAPEDKSLAQLAEECSQRFASFRCDVERLRNQSESDQPMSDHAVTQLALINLISGWNIPVDAVLGNIDENAAQRAFEEAQKNWSSNGHDAYNGNTPARTVNLASLTDLRSLLDVAGSLYLQGVKVDLEKVNAVTDVDWKPLTLVDLPPYQWDHSKTHSCESHADLEHRTNKHQYHDLLGRRIHGLSPSTMIWKNKLSFKNVPSTFPWTSPAKPEKRLDLADFIAMTLDALAQVFESKPTSSYGFEGVVLHKPLHYDEHVYALELQTCIAAKNSNADGSADDSSYRVVIESVKAGSWTTHFEATIVPRQAAQPLNDTTEDGWQICPLEREQFGTMQASEQVAELFRVCVQHARELSDSSKATSSTVRIQKLEYLGTHSRVACIRGQQQRSSSTVNIVALDTNGDGVLAMDGVTFA